MRKLVIVCVINLILINFDSKGFNALNSLESCTIHDFLSSTLIQNEYSSAYIKGSNVNLRTLPSTSPPSEVITLLQKNHEVTIIDMKFPDNNKNEAILTRDTRFYNNDNSFAFTLKKGKAIRVIGVVDEKFRISYTDASGQYRTAKVLHEVVDFINNQPWYKVKTEEGIVGWVFGKYVIVY